MGPFKMNKNALLHKIKSTLNAIGTHYFFKHYSKLDRISFYLNHPYKKLCFRLCRRSLKTSSTPDMNQMLL